jgi:hypothetical protein
MKNITKKYPEESPIKLHINPDNLLDGVKEKDYYIGTLNSLASELIYNMACQSNFKNWSVPIEFTNEMIYAIVSVFVMFNHEDILKNSVLLSNTYSKDIINDAIKQFKESLALE